MKKNINYHILKQSIDKIIVSVLSDNYRVVSLLDRHLTCHGTEADEVDWV